MKIDTFQRMRALLAVLDFHAGEDFPEDTAQPYNGDAFAGLLADADKAGEHGHVLIIPAEHRDSLIAWLRQGAAIAIPTSPSPKDETDVLNAMLAQLGIETAPE